MLAGRLTLTLYKGCSCQNVLESLSACVCGFCLAAMMMMFSAIYSRIYVCLNMEEVLSVPFMRILTTVKQKALLSRWRNTKQQKNKSALSACLVKKKYS